MVTPSLKHRLRVGLWATAVCLLAAVLFVLRLARLATTRPAPPYEGTVLDTPAPDFQLTDQTGTKVALSDFRGQVVVLAFLDSRCEDVCPLTAAHLRAAGRLLGKDAASVVFLAVNVNPEANAVGDVAQATREWRLDEIPHWHFLTGRAEDLASVWAAYHITVVTPSAEGEELVHTSGVFLIDQAGRQRWYVSTPFDEAGATLWTAPLSDLLVKHVRELLPER